MRVRLLKLLFVAHVLPETLMYIQPQSAHGKCLVGNFDFSSPFL